MKTSEFPSPVIPTEIPREPEMPQMDESAIQDHLHAVVREKLPLVLKGLAGLYVLYTVYCLAVYPWNLAWPMTRLSLLTAGLFITAHEVFRRKQLPDNYIYPFCLFSAGLAVVNALLHFHLFSDPYQTCLLMLLITGYASFVTSRQWFILTTALCVAAWAPYALLSGNMSWFYFGFGLCAAVLLGFILNRNLIVHERQLAIVIYSLADRRMHLNDFVARARSAEERARKLSEATFEGILFHQDGIITDANATAQDMFGYTVKELRGKHLLILVAQDARQTVSSQLRFGTVQSNCATGVRKDKTEFPIEIFNKSIPMQEGPLQIIAVRDITGQREAQLALAREKKELEGMFQRQTLLNQIDLMVDNASNLRLVFKRITQIVTEALPASAGACLLFWQENEGMFRVGSIYPPQALIHEDTQVTASVNSANAYLLEHGEPLVFSSMNDDHMSVRETFPGMTIQACAALPLLSEGRMLGILYVFDKFSRVYKREDMEFLQQMANRTAMVYTKYQLFTQLRTANQNLQSQQNTLQHTINELEMAKATAEEANRSLKMKQEQLETTIAELECKRVCLPEASPVQRKTDPQLPLPYPRILAFYLWIPKLHIARLSRASLTWPPPILKA